MKIQGQISVALTAADFVEAAEHQRRLEGLLRLVQEHYPDATLQVRERRERARVLRAPAPLETGRVVMLTPHVRSA